ncbi:hypothetical protein DU000_01635 [Parvibium lacunae]|uniref:L,D-TPase catalytic domain-containing protein n=2 Tax=Parvibium lacunae TaxID=1888893 RepID=A0A368L8A6_9BURK|nr:hypothetical protein DU000_01635 [Parvibium lacunae]
MLLLILFYRFLIRFFPGLVALTFSAAVAAQSPALNNSSDIEAQLNKILRAIAANRMSEATKLNDALLQAYPNFRLAYLIQGDLLRARVAPLRTIGDIPNIPDERVRALREEALQRLRGYLEKPPSNRVPRYLLQLRTDQRTAIVVDTKRSRLYVYENTNGQPRFLADFYMTQGKSGSFKLREGDEKTPIGVYHVTSSIPDSKLDDFYGAGAFPINYPNEWDRLNGRTGSGIWLHGVPSNTYSRPPKASNGCVVLSNPDLQKIAQWINPGTTPVVISEEVEWLNLDDWQREREQFQSAFDTWRRDWESRDMRRYLGHYAMRFQGDGLNYNQWAERKNAVNQSKTWIKVGVSNLSMFRYPNKSDEMIVVTFDQDYKSNNLENKMRKRQFWIKEQGRWRILVEEAA